ncbi:uncharacterized protein LOC119769756 [Culex quinquefasciatus]|uniref:uncharacterized protein LOC119769756 n=1 Tax=Culex quinquefasciatus TaxID=7176 RepID=UPI0018E32F65|nr:uncharacterized protein LOC119769756 [Culex quinquefasciatus]
MSLAVPCTVCSKAIKEEQEKVMCFGSCGKITHLNCCGEVDKHGFKAISTNIGIKYLCHGCRKTQTSYNCVLEKCNEIMKNMENIKNDINEKLQKMEENIAEKIKSDMSNMFTKMCEDQNKSEEKRMEAFKNQINQWFEEKKEKQWMLQVVAFYDLKQKMARMQKIDSVIIVKPKADQTTRETKQELRSQIDRTTNNISLVREGNGGSVILGVKQADQVESVIKSVQEKFGEKYEVSVPKPKNPRLKIVSVEDELSESELKESLVDQNELLEEMELKLITKYQRENAAGYISYTYVLEVDATSHEIMLEAERVNFGWERCRVIECFGIIRCFKCCNYGHKSTECKGNEVCAKCTGQHRTAECTSERAKCINCERMNKSRKLNLSIDHFAFSHECAIYKRLVARKRQQIEHDQ